MPRRLFRSATADKNRFVLLYIGIAAALLCAAGFFIYEATIIRAEQARDDTSVAVLEVGNRVLHDLENLETGQRGYLLMADDQYLQPYKLATRDLDDMVLRLHQLVANDPQSALLVRRIEHAKNLKVMEVSRTLELARSGDREGSLELMRTGEGKRYMDALREDLGVLLGNWRQVRRAAVQDVDRRVILGAGALAFIAVLVCCLLIYTLFIQRRAFARVHAYTALLNRQASKDVLTGLPNRRHLLAALEALTVDADTDTPRVAMLYLDIDGFKAVNDTLGHKAGDAILRALARALREATRPQDVLTRIGGDEFVLLSVDYIDDAQLRELAARLGESVRMVGKREFSGRFPLGVSIGIATYPDTVESLDGLLDAADAAMYEAKRAGRSSYAFANTEGQQNVLRLHR
ncbi:diguanylate cyclase [Caballeronia cordobensis]|uniref:diguanylate cyclase n=1 Tax=Caballeronia cordobensis TaxID=1353886 RepID=UPI0006AD6FB4|nr:diguanylate cyclase [Caballeronia cordobensis]